MLIHFAVPLSGSITNNSNNKGSGMRDRQDKRPQSSSKIHQLTLCLPQLTYCSNSRQWDQEKVIISITLYPESKAAIY